MATEIIKVPDIGTTEKVTIIEVAVQVGDVIAEDDTLIVLESDKASMDVPAPMAGTITQLKIKEGDEVGEGDEILYLTVSAEAADHAEPKPTQANNARAPAEQAEAAVQTESTAQETQQTLKVPDIGTTESVDIIEVHVQPGDRVEIDDSLITLESDKASMDVPALVAGEVLSLHIKVGDSVKQDDAILDIRVKAADAAPKSNEVAQTNAKAPAQVETPAPAKSSAAVATPMVVRGHDDDIIRPSNPVHAGPAVRKLAREFGVDLALVQAGGPRERIVKDDVAHFVKNKLQQPAAATSGAGIASIPDQDFSVFGEAVEHELSRIQQLTAANMARNWLNIPHVTQFDEADVTELEAFRNSLKRDMEKRGIKLSPLAFIVKVCAAALHEFPQFNVSLRANGTHFVQKHYVHIGIAVDTPNGLLVPVIRDADQKSIWTIAEEIIDLATRGRKGQIKSNEMQGGSFTISSLGSLGGTAFTPIVNAPEVAILGVSKNQVKPHWNGASFEPRTFTPLSLSYDHRAVNGADAARFTTYVCAALQDMRRILL